MANRARLLVGVGLVATTGLATVIVACGTDSSEGGADSPAATTTATTTSTAPGTGTTTSSPPTPSTPDASPEEDAGPPARPEPTLQLSAHTSYGTCAAKADGTVLCWGGNPSGNLGRTDAGSADPKPTPVPGIRGQSVRMSTNTSCAVADGGVACWGQPSCAANGIPGGEDGGPQGFEPVRVAINGVDEVAPFATGVCARIGTDVKCWGQTNSGALGNYDAGSSVACSQPAGISFSGVKSLGSTIYGVCALKLDGTIWCWGMTAGFGEYGRITDAGPDASGDLTAGTPLAPMQVKGIDGVRTLGIAYGHSCAIKNDGSVWCWGLDASALNSNNPGGQIGRIGPFRCPASNLGCDTDPKAVPGLTGVRELAGGVFHTCAVKNDDTVVCWGNSNAYSFLGHNPNDDRDGAAPDAAVTDDVAETVPKPVVGLSNVAHVTAGAYHSCAVTWDSKVFCWGANMFSALGPIANDGGPMPQAASFVPIEVPIP